MSDTENVTVETVAEETEAEIEVDEINADTLSKLGLFHANLPDIPNKSAAELKAFFDHIPRNILIPKINEIIAKLRTISASLKENVEITNEEFELLYFILNEKIEIEDYGGTETRSSNDFLVIENQDMSICRDGLSIGLDDMLKDKLPAKELINPFLPCDLNSLTAIEEAVKTYGEEDTESIPLLALVSESFVYEGFPNELTTEGLAAAVYLCKSADGYVIKGLNESCEKTWSLTEFIEGDVLLLEWLETLGFMQDEIYVYFGDAYFYYHVFLSGYVSKIFTETDFRRSAYSKKQMKKLFYDIEQSDRLLAKKANADDVFTKKESEILLNGKANAMDFLKINQAYIKDGKVIGNNGTKSTTAKYIGVDMKYQPYSGKIKFGFTDNKSHLNTVLIILTKLGNQTTQNITHGSIHIGVSVSGVSIEYFDGVPEYVTETDAEGNEVFVYDKYGEKQKAYGPLKTLYKHTFATKLEPNTTYELSFEMVQQRYVRLTFPMADANGVKTYEWYSNSSDTRYDAIWEALAGRYMIFEQFSQTEESTRGYFVGWEAVAPQYMLDVKDENGNVLHKGYLTAKKEYSDAVKKYLADGTTFDTNALTEWSDKYELYSLKHEFNDSFDGELISAPTGQVYSLFNR